MVRSTKWSIFVHTSFCILKVIRYMVKYRKLWSNVLHKIKIQLSFWVISIEYHVILAYNSPQSNLAAQSLDSSEPDHPSHHLSGAPLNSIIGYMVNIFGHNH